MLVPAGARRAFSAFVAAAGFLAAGVLAAFLFNDSEHAATIVHEAAYRDQLGGVRADPHRRLRPARGRRLVRATASRRSRVGEYYALLATAAAGMTFMVAAGNLMTLFLGLEWFSISLYILCAIDLDRPDSLEAGLKYLIVGSFGSAVLLFGSALVYGSTQEIGFEKIAAATAAKDLTGDALLVAGLAMIIAGLGVQVLRGAVPHVDARRVPGLAHAGHRVHVGGDEGRRARRDAPHPHRRLPAARQHCGRSRSP